MRRSSHLGRVADVKSANAFDVFAAAAGLRSPTLGRATSTSNKLSPTASAKQSSEAAARHRGAAGQDRETMQATLAACCAQVFLLTPSADQQNK